jgi:predicted protein tyrosine phosphatase
MEHNQKQAIRQAVSSREYTKARRLWAEYIGRLRGQFERGALTQAEIKEARELFEWARVTLVCQRAHLQQRLRGLQVAGLYRQLPPAEKRRRLQTSG